MQKSFLSPWQFKKMTGSASLDEKSGKGAKVQAALTRILSEFPYLRSPIAVIDKALEAADLSRREIFADLGCGDGVVLIRAAERFGVFSVGFEINPILVRIAQKRIKSANLQDLVDVVRSDLFLADLSRFDVIYVYPSPLVIEKLSRKILDECAGGTRILVHDYPLRLLKPVKVAQIPHGELHTHTLYVYEI